jgi:antitoxin HicB
MQIFEYRARFEPGERKGTLVVSFPDLPEAITEGNGEAQARANAEEALGLALLSYPQRGLALPKPRARGAKLVSIAVEPEIAAKLALLEAIRERGLSKSAFARLIGRDEKEVRRILDPRHSTKLSTLSEALRALGQQMVIKTERLRELVPA